MSTTQAAMSTQGTGHALHGSSISEPAPWVDLAQRLQKAERQSRWLKYTLLVMAPLLIYVFIGQEIPDKLIEREALVAADRMQLFDDDGNARMYMRVYSGVPVVQLIDKDGVPRLSMGLRYDDSPFISLSDVTGQTRASLQVADGDKPALKLFDENGVPSFSAQ